MTNVAHVFPDTNVLLHFEALDGLDWAGLCSRKDVVLHITQSLLAELNSAKDASGSSAIRKRAKTVQRRLKAIHAGQDAKLPAGLAIKFLVTTPDVAAFSGLNPRVADDALLAEVLFFKQSEPDAEIFVATDDDGFGLRVKCGSHGLQVIEPPEQWRLDPEPDDRDIELRRLRKEVETLRNARPNLAVHFLDGENRFSISPEAFDIESRVKAFVEKLRSKFPEMRVREEPKGYLANVMRLDIGPKPAQIATYNRELSEFFVISEDVARKRLESKSRTIFFALAASNSGSAPANDLLIHIHFPDGFVLRKKDEWESFMSDLPRPPEKPRTLEDTMASLANLQAPRYPFATAGQSSYVAPEPSLSIRKTNSYDVEFAQPKLKHGQEAVLGQFALTFDKAPFSFQAEYSAMADNLPETIEGNLLFVPPTEEKR
jgi:hypothetical protein